MRTLPFNPIPLFILFTGILFAGDLHAQGAGSGQDAFQWQDGDILFQRSEGPQSKALQEATGSDWTHCGIVFLDKDGPYVIEAVQPVRRTALDTWLSRAGGIHAVKRLADERPLTPEVLQKMRDVAQGYMGRNYDIFFQWDDDRIYCSELVWKIYKQGAGLEVGEVERFGDMDLSGAEARRILDLRFGDTQPLEEPVVTPVAIYRSPLLRTVKEAGGPARQ